MLVKVKSQYILKNIIECIDERKFMKMIKDSKSHQNKLNLTLENFKTFIQIKIEIIPVSSDKLKRAKNYFINCIEDKRKYFICFNNDKKAVNREYITPEDKVDKITVLIGKNIKSLADLFYNKKQGSYTGCDFIKEIKFIRFFNKDITDMSCMFYGCSGLNKIDFTNFNTENVKNMSYMFYGCSSLVTLDLSNFKVDNVTNMFSMFSKCSSLIELDFKKFNTQKVVNMGNMFENCNNLKRLKNFNLITNNVTNMGSMFEGCSSLSYINVANFNTLNVYTFENMFKECISLSYLDISGFVFKHDSSMREMFSNCNAEFKKEIINQNNLIKEEAFYDELNKNRIIYRIFH